MTDSFATRCPHCSTRLRVTQEQISVAGGVVRCGTCLQTFNATEHLLDDLLPEAGVMDELLIHDDLDLNDLGLADELDLGEELAQIEVQEQAFSQELLDLSQQISSTDNDEQSDADESWAEELLREEEERGFTPSKTAVQTLTTQALAQQNDELEEDETSWLPYKESSDVLSVDKVTQVTPEDFVRANALKPPAQGLRIVGVDENEPFAAPSQNIPNKKKPADATSKAKTGQSRTEQNRVATRSSPNRVARTFIQKKPVKAVKVNTAACFKRLAQQRLRLLRSRRLLWLGVSLCALLGLAGQYVFFHFDSLIQQESARPWLARVCPLLGCKVPGRMDISQIRSSNLVVHSHPEITGALIVDVILHNRASFAQPFPVLELEFSNVAGRPMARRRFTPKQYLAGEMQGKLQIPPQVPIHIALEIKDPGSEAVNYSLNLLPFK